MNDGCVNSRAVKTSKRLEYDETSSSLGWPVNRAENRKKRKKTNKASPWRANRAGDETDRREEPLSRVPFRASNVMSRFNIQHRSEAEAPKHCLRLDVRQNLAVINIIMHDAGSC